MTRERRKRTGPIEHGDTEGATAHIWGSRRAGGIYGLIFPCAFVFLGGRPNADVSSGRRLRTQGPMEEGSPVPKLLPESPV